MFFHHFDFCPNKFDQEWNCEIDIFVQKFAESQNFSQKLKFGSEILINNQ